MVAAPEVSYVRSFVRGAVIAVLLTAGLLHAQERSFIARFDPPAGAQVTPQETFTQIFKTADVPVTSVQSLRGTPLYVAIVMEGGKDRAFSRDLALRYVAWFAADPDLRGMMAVYAHNGLQSTDLTADYGALRQRIASFKPARDTQDAAWQGVLVASRALGEQGEGKPVRRLVVLIQDPSAYGLVPGSDSFIPPPARGAQGLAAGDTPTNVLKILQVAQLYETVIAVEEHAPSRPISTRPYLAPPVISPAELDLIREYSPGILLSTDFSHGEQVNAASFLKQAGALAHVLDSLYRVTLTLPPSFPDGLTARLLDQGPGAGVYPKTINVTPFGPPVRGAEHELVARIEPLMHSPTLLADRKFASGFEKRGGSLQSVESLKDTSLYVAIAVEGGTDPILNNEVPARYAKWFTKNPHLRGMMVAYGEDEQSKPRLYVHTRPLAYHMTRNYSDVLKRIRSFNPSENTPTFREVLLHACQELADQEPGKKVRRLLFVITHPSTYGPDLDPAELVLAIEDTKIFMVAEDHGPYDLYGLPELVAGEGYSRSIPSDLSGLGFGHPYRYDYWMPWGADAFTLPSQWLFFATALSNSCCWASTPWGLTANNLKRLTPALFLRIDYSHGKKTTDMFFDAQVRRLAEALDNLYWVRFVPPQTRHPNYEFSLHISDPGAHVHPQAVLLNLDLSCDTGVRTLFGRCAAK